MGKRYYRAFIYHAEAERVYFDFKSEREDAMWYAESKGFGDVIQLTTLPECYSPYLASDEPANCCDGNCPSECAGEAEGAFTPKVFPLRSDTEPSGIWHVMLGSCPVDNDSVAIGKNKGIKHLIGSLIGKKD